MRTWLAVGFGTLTLLPPMMATDIHFAEQEEALRAEAQHAVTADRAKHEVYAGRHIMLDCAEIHSAR